MKRRPRLVKTLLSWLREKLVLLAILGLSVLLWMLHLYAAHRKPDIDHALKSVVTIENASGNVRGTGFFFSPEPCVLTADHVPWGFAMLGETMQVGLKDSMRKYTAVVTMRDPLHDLAVLCMHDLSSAPAHLDIVHSNDLTRGDKVFALGHPGGRTWNLTEGIVSRMGYKMVPFNTEWVPRYTIFITAYIAWGSSGGPVLDQRGRVRGIVVAFDSPGPLPVPTNMNLVVSSTDMLRFLSNY
jgi:S1-C subfamily serine protease